MQRSTLMATNASAMTANKQRGTAAPAPLDGYLQWVPQDASTALDMIDEEIRRIDRHDELLRALQRRVEAAEQRIRAALEDARAVRKGLPPPSTHNVPRYRGSRYAPAEHYQQHPQPNQGSSPERSA